MWCFPSWSRHSTAPGSLTAHPTGRQYVRGWRRSSPRSHKSSDNGVWEVRCRIAPGVEWDGSELLLPVSTINASVELCGRGLALVPTTARFAEPAVILEGPWQQTVFFSIGSSWARTRPVSSDLAELLGQTRAAILAAIATPATTSNLALQLREDPGNVSRHLYVLHRAGLATARGYGRRVWYGQTEAARSLFAPDG